MKMRKKLAALLAAAMIASVMPMTAFAASTNRVTNTVTAKKDAELNDATAPRLKIDLKDALAAGKEFYLDLENAEWTEDAVWGDVVATGAGVTLTLTRVDGKTLGVKVKSAGGLTTGAFEIPLLTKLTGGEASVTIDSNDTVVTAGKYVFATSNDAKAKVKVGDVSTFADSGKVATLTFEEAYIGAFKNTKTVDQYVTVELNDKNFSFTDTAAKPVKLVGKKAYAGTDIVGVISRDGQKVTFTVPAGTYGASQRGALEISDLGIRANNKAVEGDVEVYIDGYFLEDETVVVAKFGDYSTKLTTKEVKEFTAGSKKTVKFTLEEVAGDAINKNRATTFTFSDDIEILTAKSANLKNGEIVIDADDKNVFTVKDFSATDALKDNKAEFEVEINIPAKFTGDLEVKAEGRSLEETKELKLADVKAPVTVEVEPMKVAVGTKSNKGGKLTITETDKKSINRGKLVIQLPQDLKDDGVEFTNVEDLVIETTGGIKADKAKYVVSPASITIEVTRQSTEAGTIEVSGFEVKARRTIADGAYEVEVGGPAISNIANLTVNAKQEYTKLDAITSVDFILVGNARVNAVTVFTIGSEKFTVDGKEITMDAAAYIKDGRTMVPLRYLSYALGINSEAISFNNGIVTIFAEDGKLIQVTNGSKSLTINGMTVPMVSAAEIVENRMYVPITEIAKVFNVTGTWNEAAQTATFK